MFDLIPRYGAFSPAKIIYKGFTRYGNACILESVHRLPRENTNSAAKPRNSSICFFTYTRWSNDYSKLVRKNYAALYYLRDIDEVGSKLRSTR